MTGIRVHHLNCAHLRRLSLGGLPLACHVLLVETPASELVLVDSGLGTADAFFDPREVHGPRRVCAPRIRLFEAAVTTNWRQRVANARRLRRLTAEHPEIDVFCAHDPAPLASLPTRPAART
jgi:glyoxylase-like metal-dependent hydrolase (beta-lactamase superfamily II)